MAVHKKPESAVFLQNQNKAGKKQNKLEIFEKTAGKCYKQWRRSGLHYQIDFYESFYEKAPLCLSTLGSGINVALRLLIFGFFSRGYALIQGGYGYFI